MLYVLMSKVWKRLPRKGRILLSRSIQTKFTVSAAGIITNEKGEVLLLNHILRPIAGWGLPGGFMDAYEQPEAAFRREIKEETGLEVRHVKLYRARTIRRHLEIIFIAAGVGTAEVRSREITELGWFAIDAMPAEMSLDQQFLITNALASSVQRTVNS
jgi:ADP-ribose pyrophosphatase YjhB (NUDIX family)